MGILHQQGLQNTVSTTELMQGTLSEQQNLVSIEFQ